MKMRLRLHQPVGVLNYAVRTCLSDILAGAIIRADSLAVSP